MSDTPVLLVSEDDELRDLHVWVLANAGIRCLPARNADAGLRHATMFKFGAAILNVGPSGWQDALRLAAQLRAQAHPPALIALSHEFPSDKDLAIFAKRLRRPVAPADLILAVRRLVGD
jgi:DNA-binding response OmpR family regulator